MKLLFTTIYSNSLLKSIIDIGNEKLLQSIKTILIKTQSSVGCLFMTSFNSQTSICWSFQIALELEFNKLF